jgi:hypothetical protein
MSEESFAWFAGVDWGSEEHHACLVDAQGSILGERVFPHSGTGLAELGDWLLSIADAAGAIAVATEVPHGPVVDTLIDGGSSYTRLTPGNSTACVTDSVSPEPRTIAEMPTSWPMVYAPTGVCSAASTLLMHSSSNCVRGRALPRNCGRNGFG